VPTRQPIRGRAPGLVMTLDMPGPELSVESIIKFQI
jgi:hypothetical protein